MIFYLRSFLGLPLLCQCTGSALPRALLPALISAAIAVFIQTQLSDALLEKLVVHPYPFQARRIRRHYRHCTHWLCSYLHAAQASRYAAPALAAHPYPYPESGVGGGVVGGVDGGLDDCVGWRRGWPRG